MLTATAAHLPFELKPRNDTRRNFRYPKPFFTFLLVREFKLLLFYKCTQHLSLNTTHVILQIKMQTLLKTRANALFCKTQAVG